MAIWNMDTSSTTQMCCWLRALLREWLGQACRWEVQACRLVVGELACKLEVGQACKWASWVALVPCILGPLASCILVALASYILVVLASYTLVVVALVGYKKV